MIRYCSAGHFITGTLVPVFWDLRHRSPGILCDYAPVRLLEQNDGWEVGES
jgi:hypothetical protein